ncbi:glutathione S-transferase family protein [Sphingosinicella microcystinivorans]|uniref:glutathione S-transferase family protein n=1 Tax=Sphingosinicella microcystinivorans TaxID=335406 RepID=UPI0022F3A92B|nr:glutathione S-transferase family protein [Sphingosinicella microcystinivorans]WBX85746.1 glutathione S-transferase family protein [Sphingosinicella microcystinivorans]
MDRLTLHEDPVSGNCYKIRLTAAHLGFPLERKLYDIRKGETRTPDYLATVNANGRVPVLQVGERYLPESNAAIFWLAKGSALIPADRWDEADMLRWMFWEQYNHEPNIATLRFWLAYVGRENLPDAQRAQIDGKRAAGEAALKLMDAHLTHRQWFVGNSLSLADIALYAYTHVCEEGGAFDLAAYPRVQGWLARVAGLPGHIRIES